MLNFLRNFTGVIVSLLVIGGSFVAFSLYVATRSDLEQDTITHAENVRDSIEIYRNQFSVPHIVAKSEADAFFALGYVHAQDRLWQMDVARRAGEGRLSEIFGKEALETDKFLRTLDLNVISKKLWKASSKQSRFILEQYSKGINAYIDEHKTGLPFEFGALGYIPEPWEPHDCLLIGRMMAFEMSMSFWSDIAFGEIADKLGADRASDLIPSYPGTAPVVVPQVVQALGRLDAVVNNASAFEYDTAATFTYAMLEHHLRANTAPAIVLAQALAEHVAAREGLTMPTGTGQSGQGAELPDDVDAAVVNLLDQKLWNPNPDFISYTLSKAALESATTLLALALAPRVRVVGVAPGLTLTSDWLQGERFDQLHRSSPLGRSSTPGDVAATVAFALANRSITGTTLLVDGGQHLQRFPRDFSMM